LTGITDETNASGLTETTSQISLIDLFTDNMPFHSFRLDFAKPFMDMFQDGLGQSRKYLYLDSEIISQEQAARRLGFYKAHQTLDPTSQIAVLTVNQEVGADKTDALMSAIEEFKPDVVCGYVHRNWRDLIQDRYSKNIQVYGYVLDSERPGFVVKTDEWMGQVLPEIYKNLVNRHSDLEHHVYPAKFIR
jgi:hypothetical protein